MADRCRVLVPLCQIHFPCLIDLITKKHLKQQCSHNFIHLQSENLSETEFLQTGFNMTASSTGQAIHLKCVWVFDARVSFCWVFLFQCSVGLGCIWDIDEKGQGQNVALSYLKALSVSLGFQSVLSAERKMVV